MRDYYEDVRNNLARAAAVKDAERKEDARKTRTAKAIVVLLLILAGVAVAICGNPAINF